MSDQATPHRDVRVGVLPAAARALLGKPVDPGHLVDLAVTAERLGFDSFWAGDSLRACFVEPVTLLAAIVARTQRITAGTAALIAAFRQPLQAAQALASLDLLSRGRLVLGVGAGFPGWSDPEFAAVGIPMRRRSARLDETVALWRQLWSGAAAPAFHGELVRLDVSLEQLPASRPGGPPVWLAAGNPAAQNRAGRQYDGWIPYPPSPEGYAAAWSAVRRAAGCSGRNPDAITPALYATVGITASVDSGARLLDEFCLAVYGRPREQVARNQALIAGPAEHVTTQLDRYVAAGARHLIVRLAALDPPSTLDQLHRVAEALLPYVGRRYHGTALAGKRP